MMCPIAGARVRQALSLAWSLLVLSASSCESPTKPVSGRVQWRAAGQGWGTPAFDNTTVYFVGYDHELVAIDKSTGRVLWHGREADPGSHTSGRSAVVAADIVAIGDLDIH